MTASTKALELLLTLRPLDKELQVLWLGSTLETDVPVDVLTKDIVWGSPNHRYWLLIIPSEWFIDLSLDDSLKEQEDLLWVIIEPSSCILTKPSPPYHESNLPIEWWYPFLAWNGSRHVESWLKGLEKVYITETKKIFEKIYEITMNSRQVQVPSNPILLIQMFQSFFKLLNEKRDNLEIKQAFCKFIDITSRKNPLLGHLLVKARGLLEIFNDETGDLLLWDVSNKLSRFRHSFYSLTRNE